jgi:hypothetical protein
MNRDLYLNLVLSMQLLELSVGTIRVAIKFAGTILHIRVGHCRIRRAFTARSWISIWPLVHGTHWVDIGYSIVSCSVSQVWVNIITFGASRGGGTLVFYDFLKYIMENSFWIIRIANLRTNTQYVTTFFNVILNIIISTFVCKLSHFNFLICKLFI